MITQTGGIRQTLDNTAQWKIYYSSNGYVLQNRYTGYYLNMSMDSASEYGVHFATTVGSIAKWSFDYAYVPSGIALYDTENFAWVDTTTSIILNVGAAWKPVCMPIDTHSGSFTVSSDSLVGYSSGTGLITGVTCGDYTSTRITHSCGNATSTFSVKVILPLSGYEAAYEPARWNTAEHHIFTYTNCYAYALNRQTDMVDGEIPDTATGSAVQPGSYAGDPVVTDDTKQMVKQAILNDGIALGKDFSIVERNEVCPAGTYKIALYVATPGASSDIITDYHFYRQNPDGSWSHKAPEVAASLLDSSGNIIWDPEDATHNYSSTRNYNKFVCYLAITPLNVLYPND